MIKSLIRKRKKDKKDNEGGQEGMSFLDHLEELRGRLIKSIAAVIILAIPCAVYWNKIFTILMVYPLRFAHPKPHLIFTAPAEAIMLSMKIALVGGIVLAVPFIFYQLWAFISPGLYGKEKRVVLPIVISSSLSFFLGITFCYFMVPLMIKVLASFGAGVMEPYFKASEYIGFLIKISLACGLIFELPVVSYVLTKMGLLTSKFLISKVRHAIVVIFIVAAVLTPPDVLSQLFLAIPLMLIYGISILVSHVTEDRSAVEESE
jgi:sec-independent protein translocase protein TatC